MDDKHVGRMLKRLNDSLEREANRQMRDRKVSMSQMRVLHDLHRNPAGTLSLKELETSVGVAQSTMWGLVSRLESKGMVRTFASEEGSRARSVMLTDKGNATCEAAIADVEDTERHMLAGLSEREVDELRRLLTHLYDNLN